MKITQKIILNWVSISVIIKIREFYLETILTSYKCVYLGNAKNFRKSKANNKTIRKWKLSNPNT